MLPSFQWRRWLAQLSRLGRTRSRKRKGRLGVEHLEDRVTPSVATTHVNDNWHFLTDTDGSLSLTAGDVVQK